MSGIYIHIPFCKSRCKYCDFFSTIDLKKQDAYIDAVIKEWEVQKEQWLSDTNKKDIRTIYIGGGTPSLLSIENLQKLVNTILLSIDESMLEEITLEANPGDFTAKKVRAWHEIGINRLSIGIQSFNNRLLQLIGRRHDAKQAQEAVSIARSEGITNISIDLMYALPTQTMKEWKADIELALKLDVPHISSYGLIYEDGTPLSYMLETGQIDCVEEEEEILMYDYLVEQLTKNGYEHYEVSNFARVGLQSKHNSSYWNDTPYLGLGAGAHSYDGDARWWNINNLDLYISQAKSHSLQPIKETLTDEERRMERIMLGLRTNKGVCIEHINPSRLQTYIEAGLLEVHGKNVIATTKGYHILNRIIEDFI